MPERLSTLAHRAVAERLSSQEKTTADLSARLGPTARAVEEKKGPSPFMSSTSLSPNIDKFKFYTGLLTTLAVHRHDAVLGRAHQESSPKAWR